jgi:hypothetical protein
MNKNCQKSKIFLNLNFQFLLLQFIHQEIVLNLENFDEFLLFVMELLRCLQLV